MNQGRSVDVKSLRVELTLVATLLVAIAVGSWRVATVLSRMEAKLEEVSPENLKRVFYTRSEASLYHREFEHALQDAGLKIRFPPPSDPIIAR